jgi:nucleotide-binding universal stress UspA family protein
MAMARILVATDFTKTSDDALVYAEMLATQFASELHLLHVVPDARQEPWASEAVALNLDELTEDWIRDAECKLQRIARRLPSPLHVRTATRFGPLLDEILTYAEGNQIDLVVLGVACTAASPSASPGDRPAWYSPFRKRPAHMRRLSFGRS